MEKINLNNSRGIINHIGKSMVIDTMQFGSEICASFLTAMEAKKAVKNLNHHGYITRQNTKVLFQ